MQHGQALLRGSGAFAASTVAMQRMVGSYATHCDTHERWRRAGHERRRARGHPRRDCPRLGEGWYAVEGVYGNKYRWMRARALARLKRVRPGALRLRIRGHAAETAFATSRPRVRAIVNGAPAGEVELDRPGLFILEADVPDAPEYEIVVEAEPVWRAPGDLRDLTVNLSLMRLVERGG